MYRLYRLYRWVEFNTSLCYLTNFGLKTFLEAWFIRWGRCVYCGKWFLKHQWWTPFAVNPLEEHCSFSCATAEIDYVARISSSTRRCSCQTPNISNTSKRSNYDPTQDDD